MPECNPEHPYLDVLIVPWIKTENNKKKLAGQATGVEGLSDLPICLLADSQKGASRYLLPARVTPYKPLAERFALCKEPEKLTPNDHDHVIFVLGPEI